MNKPLFTTSLLIGTVLLLFVAAAVLWITLYYGDRNNTEPFTKQKWLALIDADQNHQVSISSIIDGDDAILVLDPDHKAYLHHLQALGLKTSHDLSAPFTLESLDANHDSIISPLDPMYFQLEVLSFKDHGKKIVVLPMDDTEFRVIRLGTLKGQHGEDSIVTSDGQSLLLEEVAGEGLGHKEPPAK